MKLSAVCERPGSRVRAWPFEYSANESDGFRSGFIADGRGIESTLLLLGTDPRRQKFLACRMGVSHSA